MIVTTRSFVVLKLIEIRFACKLLLLLRRVGSMFSFIKNTHAALGVVYVRVLYAGCVMKKVEEDGASRDGPQWGF